MPYYMHQIKTSMNTEISPAAQRILAALEESSYDWSSMEPAHPRDIAAAVLRAAALEIPMDGDILENLAAEM